MFLPSDAFALNTHTQEKIRTKLCYAFQQKKLFISGVLSCSLVFVEVQMFLKDLRERGAFSTMRNGQEEEEEEGKGKGEGWLLKQHSRRLLNTCVLKTEIGGEREREKKSSLDLYYQKNVVHLCKKKLPAKKREA